MFYQPNTNLVFQTIQEFQLFYKDTSFGDLTKEENRNAIGLFRVKETSPEYDEDLMIKEFDGVELLDGKYQTKWKLVNKQLSTDQLAEIAQNKNKKLKQYIIDQTQKRLDDFAKSNGYDSILSACTYATSSVAKFRSEGQYCVDVRDSTWSTLYQYMTNIESGIIPVPTSFSDVEPLLPNLQWPI